MHNTLFEKGVVHAAMLHCMTHLFLVMPCRLSVFGHLASFSLYSFELHAMAQTVDLVNCACSTINMLMNNAAVERLHLKQHWLRISFLLPERAQQRGRATAPQTAIKAEQESVTATGIT